MKMKNVFDFADARLREAIQADEFEIVQSDSQTIVVTVDGMNFRIYLGASDVQFITLKPKYSSESSFPLSDATKAIIKTKLEKHVSRIALLREELKTLKVRTTLIERELEKIQLTN